MTINSWLQVAVYLAVLLLCVKPFGAFMARVYEGDIPAWLRWMTPLERGLYKICGVKSTDEMNWKSDAGGILLFNLVGVLFLYALQRMQGFLPRKPLRDKKRQFSKPANCALI